MVRAEGVPHHREAYPRFNIIQAKAEHERQATTPICVFSQGRMKIGHLIISKAETNSIDLDYYIGTAYIQSGIGLQTIFTKPAGNGIDKFRVSIICPDCSRSTFNFYYVGRWACAACHELTYRCKLVGRETAAYERRDELVKLVGKGRPKHMRNATYLRLRTELSDLELWLRGRTFTANDVHLLKVDAEWKSPAEVGELWINSHVIRDGKLVRVEADR